jgi:aldehyde dehydrogenase (NAD+)
MTPYDKLKGRKEQLDQYYRQNQTKPYSFRLKQLESLEQMIRSHTPAICEALYKDLKKPQQEALLGEVSVLLTEIKYTKKKLKSWMREQKVSTPLTLWPGRSRIISEPLGTVLIIAPWNYPFNLALAPLIGAIAAGNCAILKPSELTPHTSTLLHQLISQSFDQDYICVVEGAIEETSALLQLDFDHIFFTGSTPVGKIIMKAAAENLTPVTLELGGKSPAFISRWADLELAAKRIVWGKFFNAGQTCVAPDYLYVDKKIAEKFQALLIKEIKVQFSEAPQTSKSLARIVNDKHFERLTKMMKEDEVFYGGTSDKNERYIEPTLLGPCHWDSASMQDEIFGPVLPILTYHSFEDAIGEVTKRAKPLSAYLFTQDRKESELMIKQLSCGGICVNDVLAHLSNHHLPFGGVGASGMGSYHGKKSFDTFSHQKSVLYRTKYLDLSARYAPYTQKGLKLIKWLFGLS